jgi:hypothetical protein
VKEYITPLAERQRISRWYKERYWGDPAFRLRKINGWRIWKGLEPYSSLDEMQKGRAA